MRKAMDRDAALATAAHEILRPAYPCWPDVVLLVSAFWYPPYLLDMMRGRGMKVVLLHTESPYQDDEQLVRAAHADMNLLNDPVNIEPRTGTRPRRVHAARLPADASTTRRRSAPTRNRTSRSSAPGSPPGSSSSSQMDLAGLNVRLAGPWMDLPETRRCGTGPPTDPDDCVDNHDTAGIYRQARTGINLYRPESEDAHDGRRLGRRPAGDRDGRVRAVVRPRPPRPNPTSCSRCSPRSPARPRQPGT